MIYGHELETVNADDEYETVMDYFSGQITTEQQEHFYQERGIDFLYYGPREQNIGTSNHFQGLYLVYETEKVAIYQVLETP